MNSSSHPPHSHSPPPPTRRPGVRRRRRRADRQRARAHPRRRTRRRLDRHAGPRVGRQHGHRAGPRRDRRKQAWRGRQHPPPRPPPPPAGPMRLMSFPSHAINATLYPTLPFDPVKDFTALTCVATSPSILVAHPSVPAKDMRELIALAKARPGQLNIAIGALGSSLHMAGEAFKMQSGVDIVNIPYQGTSPAVQDLLAGQVQLMFAAIGNVKAHIQAGKLKALGVSSAQRLPAFPYVPAIAEALPGYESSAWFGLFGPARMPAALARKISDAARDALQQPGMR